MKIPVRALLKFVSSGLLGWLLISGCRTTVAPISKVVVPSSYHVKQIDSVSHVKITWHFFHRDSCLRKLIQAGLENNMDRTLAFQRILLARADKMYVSKNSSPSVNAKITGYVEKFGDYTMNGIGNDDTNRSGTLPADKKLPTPYKEFFSGLAFNWEIDLWGKLRAQREAASSRLMASVEAQYLVDTWLISEIAKRYYELLGLDQEKRVLEENIELQELSSSMARIQKEGGVINQLGVDQFEVQLLNTRGILVGVDQRILKTEAALARLQGTYPVPVQRISLSFYTDSAKNVLADPTELLLRRPDIKQAEQELKASQWDLNSARAAFLPSLNIMGGLGLSAFNPREIANLPASAAFQTSGGLVAPILQRSKLKASLRGAEVRREMALVNYKRAILIAYHDMYNAIINNNAVQRQLALKEMEAERQSIAVANANDLFNAGYATYLEVITVQRKLLDAQLSLNSLRSERLQNIAELYRAAGGGWEFDRM